MEIIEFELEGEFIELYKLLKVLGLSENGAQAKFFIGEGLVEVNGEQELRKRKKIIKGDQIIFEEQKIDVK